jgi:hypothetical protein
MADDASGRPEDAAATPDGSRAGGDPLLAVVVPDDIRDLQADIDAYHRELRRERRRRRRERLLGSAVWRRWSFPAGVMTGAVVLAAAVFVALAVDGRAIRDRIASPAPLARPAASPGVVGALLPDVPVELVTGGSAAPHQVALRSLRPALVVLLPARCGCVDVLDRLAAQAASVQLRLVVIGPAAPDAEVASLPGRIHSGAVTAGYDTTGTLRAAYEAVGPTALVVGRDGVVSYVDRRADTHTTLELPLQAALLVGTGS